MRSALTRLSLILSLAMAAPTFAQQVDFGGLKQDTTLPVEVTADQLAVDQTSGEATFTGNVRVTQGEMILSAASLRVEYAQADKRIARLHASGGVTLVAGPDAAESAEAVYTVDSGAVEMTGNVLLTQGNTAVSGEKLVIDLKSGRGTMQGRVKTVFQPGGN